VISRQIYFSGNAPIIANSSLQPYCLMRMWFGI